MANQASNEVASVHKKRRMPMTEETLAGKYAAKIKAVAQTRNTEIETLYREYQEECKSLKITEVRDEEISSTYQGSDSLTPSSCPQVSPNQRG